MTHSIKLVNYFRITVKDQPGEAYKLLSYLANLGINLFAFAAIPLGHEKTQLTVFPENSNKVSKELTYAGIALDGPHKAIIVQGDDELGALAKIHNDLYKAGVNVIASNGVTDGKNSFGYVIYIRNEDMDKATEALGI